MIFWNRGDQLRPSIKDVAIRAGVSPATVSRVLNNHQVRPGVRERVMAAVQALEYRPDDAARSMRAHTTRIIGLLERDVRNPNFSIFCAEAEATASALGYVLFLCNSNRDSAKEAAYIDLLLRRRIDGVIIFVANEQVNNLTPLIDSKTPFLLLESEIEGIQGDSIVSDGEQGVYLATRYLLQLGHTEIAILPGRQSILPGRHRYRGYRRAMEEAGIQPDPRLVRFCEFDEDAGEREMNLLLDMAEVQPTAVIAGSNQITRGCLRTLARRGIQLPDDLSFIAFDDTDLTTLFSPPLTVVRRAQKGELSVRLLVQRITGQLPPEPQRIVTECELIVRGSTAPLRA